MAKNMAAWILWPNARLEVKEAPYPSPGPNEIVVRTIAVAINPLEFKIQDYNPQVAGKALSYPTILGADVAGTIAQVGSDVTTKEVGQRVIANCIGLQLAQPSRSAFQHYVLLRETEPLPIPRHVPLTSAVVLPLAMETAAAGLFTYDQLGLSTERLRHPDAASAKSALLVWGGSSSVGCCALQLATAAGYRVFTTASKHNHDLCLSLGASKVFDHRADDVENQIVSALEGQICVGALDCVADEEKTIQPLGRILARCTGPTKKVVSVLAPEHEKYEEGLVQAVRVSIPAYRKSEAFGTVHEWLPKALADGTLQPKPDAEIIGEGLGAIQLGMDKLRNGVSASKIVVKLSEDPK